MDYGQVKWFSDLDGYGFIEHNDGREIYFHRSVLSPEPTPKGIPSGTKVYFQVLDTSRGFEATNVQILNPLI